jgi:phosphoglycolate phosphatase-like HAD superfamily hydrolase
LVDTSESFPSAIRATVEREWSEAGFERDAAGYSPEYNAVLKRHGAFNDDYDIAWTLLNISAARTDTGGASRLSEALPSPGGLERLIDGCRGDCVEWLRGAFAEKYRRDHIREVCARDYFGWAYKLETPALLAGWRSLPLPAYIYTGRDLKEWELAKRTLSWNDFPAERVVHADTGIRKPSPEGLSYICDKFGHKNPLYFGDTASDRRAHSAFGMGRFAAIGGILPDEGMSFENIGEALLNLTGWSG